MPMIELAGRGTVAMSWTGDGPEVVVLVNGSIFNYHQWDKQTLPILRSDLGEWCRFLQYDYVGIGGSSAKTGPFRMLDLADELRDLLDALGLDQVHLLGISKGSLVGQAMLIRHQERVRSFCGLGNPNLLSDSVHETWSIFQERLRGLEEHRELWPQRVDRDNVGVLFRAFYVPALFSKSYTELSIVERLRAAIVQRMIYPALEGTYIQTIVDLFRYYTGDIADEVAAFAEGLPRVGGVPILLLNGTADTTTPVEMSRDLARVLTGAELVEFEGVTHMGPMLQKKEALPVFGRYAAFLKQVLDL